jgi:DNA uptake protein ComE-like DNA-binding protein
MERNNHSGVSGSAKAAHNGNRWMLAAGLSLLTMCAAGCNGSAPSQQQVQQDAAQTTAVAKQDAQQAVAATRQAAAVAVQDVNAAASGVKSGLQQSSPSDSTTKANLNTSTQVRLALLPGISLSKAEEIIDKRPYASPRQLVSRGVLTQEQYDKIAPDVTTR